jgi:cell division protein FtsI (penicillin-binding protein 3)
MFTITVVVDSPRSVAAYGGVVAAPIFQRIAEAALRYYGVPPTVDAPPPLLVERRAEIGPLPTVAAADVPEVVVGRVSTRNATVVPDLRGLGARDALRVLAELGIDAELRGTGVVVRQEPEAGTPLTRGLAGALWLARRPVGDAHQ